MTEPDLREVSQSPSLRGSGRFPSPPGRSYSSPSGLNPLHCGAVVASHGAWCAWMVARRVSIPFIAGQWSLPASASVAGNTFVLVSIPFIAGQWSLRAEGGAVKKNNRVSIPFIAGQWSLHSSAEAVRNELREVSIPFIAGQWSLPAQRRGRWPSRLRVSIPFIAGQWSLPSAGASPVSPSFAFQSPSLRGSGRFEEPGSTRPYYRVYQFQSPSLRGSGRFKVLL